MIKKRNIVTIISLFALFLIINQNAIAISANLSSYLEPSSEKVPEADAAPEKDKAPEADIAPSADAAPNTESSVDAAPQADIAPNDNSISADSQDECPLCNLMTSEEELDIKTKEERDIKPNHELSTVKNPYFFISKVKMFSVINSLEIQQKINIESPCEVYINDLLELFFEVFIIRIRNIANDLRVWNSMTLEQKRDWFDDNFGYLFVTYGPTVKQAIYNVLIIFVDNLRDFLQSLSENIFTRPFNIWGWIIVIKDFIKNEKQEIHDYLYDLICGSDPCPECDRDSGDDGSDTMFSEQSYNFGSTYL